ncbi:ankyrin repeat protein, putative [Entamoeba histolytica HM-1:IMSS-B]|uniref:Ankyrin repeat protein, putative n=6 Tax=Entamoeba histolytica TaxID=5759 RepID=C4M7N7_ENTH1|nr:ankyrin repeat protein, putative [Entamoeba histolytica HM-1:IMSS]EMD47761.1 ankyrin repeatcontaining protein [Entamoeba histolytica KU27]EMH73275.1 ankyrin repeat protein, putative [Entamoeba histolytica HM-1:IMSS-B]EMS17160.1 ankyrin repeat protein [Entamoeba histolytica HM-3:IMSS]ENY65180.1 ankyrin repeat protein [Entamoeba histolytica HM-1:IMSS-A]GAT97552.1 ankyrin repeat protein putative [Entamoeba histolytica]|eukprot:XP_648985.1 ankyrin repeat protein, putative [Entamoeba histolytica HM-1:IMSS]
MLKKETVIIKDDQPADTTTLPGKYSWLKYAEKIYNVLFETEDEKMRRAVFEGNASLVLDLLDNGNDLINKDKHGNTLLHIAVMARQIGMISFLVDLGLSPNHVNHKGENILMLAIQLGFNDIAFEIMKLQNFNYSTPDLNGESLLHYCARYGMALICKEILRHNININSIDFNNNNALHICCSYHSLNVARVLLINGIRTTQRNSFGHIPLEDAVQMKDREMTKLIFIAMRGNNYFAFESMIDDLMIGREDPILLLNKTPIQTMHYGEIHPILRQD